MNQVELHPYNPQPPNCWTTAISKGIVVTAYSPLGSSDRPESMKQKDEPPLLENETVKAIAQQEGITPGQLLIAWALDRNTVVIPKSTNPSRIAENFAAAAHTLSAEARSALDDIGIEYRYVSPDSWLIPGVTYEGEDFLGGVVLKVLSEVLSKGLTCCLLTLLVMVARDPVVHLFRKGKILINIACIRIIRIRTNLKVLMALPV